MIHTYIYIFIYKIISNVIKYIIQIFNIITFGHLIDISSIGNQGRTG
jgi:hypothetical protein